jgi:hypothetical protein
MRGFSPNGVGEAFDYKGCTLFKLRDHQVIN